MCTEFHFASLHACCGPGVVMMTFAMELREGSFQRLYTKGLKADLAVESDGKKLILKGGIFFFCAGC